MSGLVLEQGRLEPHSLLSPEPMEADECVGDVVGVTQAVDEPCCRVRHRLKTPEQGGRKQWRRQGEGRSFPPMGGRPKIM